MPPIEEADFVDYCVIWERTGYSRPSEPVLAAPQQYPCRWVPDHRMTSSPEGKEVEIVARVAAPVEVPEGSIFWLGLLDEWIDDGLQELFRVVSRSKAKDIGGKNTRIEYELGRFRSKLPANTTEPYA